MNENSIIKGISATVIGAEMMSLIWDLRWLIFLSFILVIVDLRFGIKAAIARGEEIRRSKAGRRTFAKFIDYLCYLVLGGLLGKAIAEPFGVNAMIVAAICIGIACLFEVDSILQNICQSRGARYNFSMWKFFTSFLKNKHSDIGDAIENGMKKEDKE